MIDPNSNRNRNVVKLAGEANSSSSPSTIMMASGILSKLAPNPLKIGLKHKAGTLNLLKTDNINCRMSIRDPLFDHKISDRVSEPFAIKGKTRKGRDHEEVLEVLVGLGRTIEALLGS